MAGTPPSVLASHCILAALTPPEDSGTHDADATLFRSLSVLKSVAQKVQESATNDKPSIARPAREAKELLKTVGDLS